MWAQLAISTVMVMVTVAVHGLGLLLLARLLRLEREGERQAHISPLSLRGMLSTFGVVQGLFALHGVEIWLYAMLFDFAGALPDLETAVYFSTITYGTVGYDDLGISDGWRIVAAIEGINGVLLLGWSTAFFIAMASRLRLR